MAGQVLKPECLVKCFSSADKLFDHLRERPADLVLIDNDQDNTKGLEYYRAVKAIAPRVKVIMFSALQDVSHAVLATKLGVSDYLNKPLDGEKLSESANRIFASLSEVSSVLIPGDQRPIWSGTSSSLDGFLGLVGDAAASEKDIVLICEPGIPGKKAAELIHANCQARDKEMLQIDLSSFEREHSESMFWNSLKQMTGEISKPHPDASAQAGMIYMDGLGSLPEHFKSSILDYFIKERPSSRQALGPRIMIRVCISEGVSKEDVERLKGPLFEAAVPTLRERKEDIPSIASALMKKYSSKYGKAVGALSNEVLDQFMAYSWPGNYEELDAMIENSVLRCKSGCVMPCDAPLDLQMLLAKSLREALANNDHFLVSAQSIFKRNLVGLLSECSGNDLETVSKFLDAPKSTLLEETAPL